MIFVTVGTQLPFDRLVEAIDHWAGKQSRSDIFAQIGPSDYNPRHIKWVKFLNPNEFREVVDSADIIISHAGMGSLITAMQLGKPIVVMPRRSDLHEHRNDHQVATAECFRDKQGVYAVFNQEELLNRITKIETLTGKCSIEPYADKNLINTIRSFILQMP